MGIVINRIQSTTNALNAIKTVPKSTFADVLQRELGHNVGCGWKYGSIVFPTEEEAVEYQREMED